MIKVIRKNRNLFIAVFCVISILKVLIKKFLVPNVNVATEKYNAKVLVGESPSGLLMVSQRGRAGGHDCEGGSTRHFINPSINSLDHGIIIEVFIKKIYKLI